MGNRPKNVVAFRKPQDPCGADGGGFDEKQVQALLEALRQASDPSFEALKPDNLAVISAMDARLSQFGVEMAEVRKLCRGQLPVLHRALKQAREAMHGGPGSLRGANDPLPAVLDFIPDAPVNRDHVVPDRWILCDNSGGNKPCISRELPPKQGEAEPSTVPVTRWPVFLTALIRNATTGNMLLEVAWKRRGAWHRLIADRGELLDSSRVVGILGTRGLPVSSKNRNHLVDYLADYEETNDGAIPLRSVSEQMGWVSPKAFLAGQRLLTVSEEDKGIEFRARDPGEAQWATAVSPRGSFEKWCEAIDTVKQHAHVMLGVYASLATPLLKPLQLPGFVIDWSYRTSTGKSVVLRTAASVWANPDERCSDSLVQTWNTTPVGFERLATALNHLPIILDDTKTVRRPQMVAEILYQAVAGHGRTRGSVGGARKTATWRTILLSTGERKATDFTKDGGAVARCIALWGPPFGGMSDAAAMTIKELEQVIFHNHGHAGPLFVEWLLRQDMKAIRERYDYVHGMMWTTLKTDLDCAVASRLAYAVAAVELAGRLVHEALALPWPYESPWCTLLAPAAEAAKDVDRAREALEAAYSWAVERQEWFYGKRQETVEDPARATEYARPPAQRWAGAWREDYLAFTRTTLKEVLETNGFEFDPIVRQWAERGWLNRYGSRIQRRTAIGHDKIWCYQLNRTALALVE